MQRRQYEDYSEKRYSKQDKMSGCLTEDIDEAAGFAGAQIVLHRALVGADDAGVGGGHFQAEELAVVLLLVKVLFLGDLDVVNEPETHTDSITTGALPTLLIASKKWC